MCIAHSAEVSGATLSLLRIVSYLSMKGHSVSLVLPGEIQHMPTAINLEKVSIKVINLPEVSLDETRSIGTKLSILRQRIRYMMRLWKYIRRGGFDLVYVNSAMAIYGGIAGKLSRKKVAWHIREDLTPTRGNKVRIAAIKKIADSVIFVCHPIGAAFAKRPPHQTWHFIPNPVDAKRFVVTESRQALRTRNGILHDALVVITIGFVTRRKGFDILLKAFAEVLRKHADAYLLIVGEHSSCTPVDHWKELQDIVEEHNMGERVRFMGYRDDVAELLHLSDVFVLSSRNEAMPVCLLEAMASGKAIVATDVDAVSEILDGGTMGIIIPPEDVPALASALSSLIRDDSRRADIARLAQGKARTIYNPEHIYQQVEKVLIGMTVRSNHTDS